MSEQAITVRVGPGRLVGGNLYEPKTKDADGRPLLGKKPGPSFGQPTPRWDFAIAVAKAGEQHWSQTTWGAPIWAEGHRCFPGVASAPHFAWKITDGDSTVPNTKGKLPRDQEGYAGHWVLWLSSSFDPSNKIFSFLSGSVVPLLEPGAIFPGCYIEVTLTVKGNGEISKPGVYLNHQYVCLRGYGERISFGVDPQSIGFGAGALPPGAGAIPVGAALPPNGVPAYGGATVGPAGGAPVYAAQPTYAQPPAPPGYAVATQPPTGPVYAAPPVVAVQPNPGFLQPQGAPPAPIAPPPAQPQAAPGRVMLPAANGATYEAFIANGWTDAAMIAAGYMSL